jgi:hypothetical protein
MVCTHSYIDISQKRKKERRKERKGKERKGKERKGKERKGKERKKNRIFKIQATELKNASKLKGPNEDSSVSLGR